MESGGDFEIINGERRFHPVSDEVSEILSALQSVRVPAVPGEYDLHALIGQALAERGIAFVHEARLAPGRRVDFLSGRVAIEVKKSKPPRARLLEQSAKYLSSDSVGALIVVSQRAISLPRTIAGKPVYLLSLDRLWGVSLP